MEPLQVEIVQDSASRETIALVNGHRVRLLPFTDRDVVRPGIDVDDAEMADVVGAHSLRELRYHFRRIRLSTHRRGDDPFREVDVFLPDVGQPVFSFRIALNLMEWARPWTLATYVIALRKVARARGLHSVEVLSTEVGVHGTSLGIDGAARSLNSILGKEIRYWAAIIQSIEEEATAQLIFAQHADSLTTFFNFPPEVAIVCEQYLLYFAQFLADLGIPADTEVQHKAPDVLFRVTPTEGPKALERIREALDAYLGLPTDPEFAVVAAKEHDLAVRQLEANVFHLQGQLAIAKAVLQAKDATIQALELSNFRYKQLLGGEVQAMGQGSTPATTAEDTEPIISGVVSVKEVEKGGFVLHTPEILRKLKRRFGGGAEG